MESLSEEFLVHQTGRFLDFPPAKGGWSWAALVASALAVVWMEAVVLRQPPRTNRAMTDVVFVPPTYRGGPSVVAELLRLVRRKRILTVLASTMMVLGILAAALRWVPGAAGQGGTVDNAVSIVSLLACSRS